MTEVRAPGIVRLLVWFMNLRVLIGEWLRRFGWELRRLPGTAFQGVIELAGHRLLTDNRSLARSYAQYPQTHAFLGRLAKGVAELRPGAGYVDVGANCGDTLALVRGAQPTMPAFCVEPDAVPRSFLLRNTAGWPQLHVVADYLGECSGLSRPVRIEGQGSNAMLVEDPAGQGMVMRSLDEVLAAWDAAFEVGLLKVDAEGMDGRILAGASRLLRGCSPVVVFEHSPAAIAAGGSAPMLAFETLLDCGYDRALVFDAFGQWILNVSLAERGLWDGLDQYAARGGRIPHYDVLAFAAWAHPLHDQMLAELRQGTQRGGGA